MPLDKSKSNIGYRLGRMFAVLETVQEESNPGTDVTMREKFYSDASTTPLEVFTNLIKVKNHHGQADLVVDVLGYFYSADDTPG